MRMVATLASLLLVALVGVGIVASPLTDSGLENLNGSLPTSTEETTGNWTMQRLVSESFRLDSVNGASFEAVVPVGASEVRIDVVPGGGVYTGPATWTGLGDCDGQTGSTGPNVDLGLNNGSGSASCVLESGSHNVQLSLPVGIMNVHVTVTAIVPAA